MKLNYCGSTKHKQNDFWVPAQNEQRWSRASGSSDLYDGRIAGACLSMEFWMLMVSDTMLPASMQWVTGCGLQKAGNLERSFSKRAQENLWSLARGQRAFATFAWQAALGLTLRIWALIPHGWVLYSHPETSHGSLKPILLSLPHDPARAAGFFAYDVWHAFSPRLRKVVCGSSAGLYFGSLWSEHSGC